MTSFHTFRTVALLASLNSLALLSGCGGAAYGERDSQGTATPLYAYNPGSQDWDYLPDGGDEGTNLPDDEEEAIPTPTPTPKATAKPTARPAPGTFPSDFVFDVPWAKPRVSNFCVRNRCVVFPTRKPAFTWEKLITCPMPTKVPGVRDQIICGDKVYEVIGYLDENGKVRKPNPVVREIGEIFDAISEIAKKLAKKPKK